MMSLRMGMAILQLFLLICVKASGWRIMSAVERPNKEQDPTDDAAAPRMASSGAGGGVANKI